MQESNISNFLGFDHRNNGVIKDIRQIDFQEIQDARRRGQQYSSSASTKATNELVDIFSRFFNMKAHEWVATYWHPYVKKIRMLSSADDVSASFDKCCSSFADAELKKFESRIREYPDDVDRICSEFIELQKSFVSRISDLYEVFRHVLASCYCTPRKLISFIDGKVTENKELDMKLRKMLCSDEYKAMELARAREDSTECKAPHMVRFTEEDFGYLKDSTLDTIEYDYLFFAQEYYKMVETLERNDLPLAEYVSAVKERANAFVKQVRKYTPSAMIDTTELDKHMKSVSDAESHARMIVDYVIQKEFGDPNEDVDMESEDPANPCPKWLDMDEFESLYRDGLKELSKLVLEGLATSHSSTEAMKAVEMFKNSCKSFISEYDYNTAAFTQKEAARLSMSAIISSNDPTTVVSAMDPGIWCQISPNETMKVLKYLIPQYLGGISSPEALESISNELESHSSMGTYSFFRTLLEVTAQFEREKKDSKLLLEASIFLNSQDPTAVDTDIFDDVIGMRDPGAEKVTAKLLKGWSTTDVKLGNNEFRCTLVQLDIIKKLLESDTPLTAKEINPEDEVYIQCALHDLVVLSNKMVVHVDGMFALDLNAGFVGSVASARFTASDIDD